MSDGNPTSVVASGRGPDGRFAKGHAVCSRKGVPNKATIDARIFRDKVLQTWVEVDGDAKLRDLAETDFGSYAKLVAGIAGKVPVTLDEVGGAVSIVFVKDEPRDELPVKPPRALPAQELLGPEESQMLDLDANPPQRSGLSLEQRERYEEAKLDVENAKAARLAEDEPPRFGRRRSGRGGWDRI